MSVSPEQFSQQPTAPVWRQLSAMFYDSLLIFALLLIGTLPWVLLNGGEAVEGSAPYAIYLLTLVFIFYAWFWRKAGQTLGMKVWKIRLITEEGYNPGWQTSFLRLGFALISMVCFGLGYWWQWFGGRTWHDLASQTRVIYTGNLPK